MKKFYGKLQTTLVVVLILGSLYFVGHVFNKIGAFTYIWQHGWLAFMFYMFGVMCGLAGMVFVAGERADEIAMEATIEDLQNQLTDEQNNYNLMRRANESLQADVDRQAGIISEMCTKYSKLYVELDILKAEKLRRNIGGSSVNDKGKLV